MAGAMWAPRFCNPTSERRCWAGRRITNPSKPQPIFFGQKLPEIKRNYGWRYVGSSLFVLFVRRVCNPTSERRCCAGRRIAYPPKPQPPQSPPLNKILIISGNFCPRKSSRRCCAGRRTAYPPKPQPQPPQSPPLNKILIISGNFCPKKASAGGGNGGG